MDQPLIDAFWSHVDKSGDCWIWTASVGSHGYGNAFDGKVRTAHRMSWEIANGPIPRGGWVLHRCDVKRCVNPAHLYVGTHEQNMRDAAERRRMRRVLTEDAVEWIRTKPLPLRRMARILGVSQRAVQHVVRGLTRKCG